MNQTSNSAQSQDIVCIVCPNGCRIHCEPNDQGFRFTGQKCRRGIDYATAELTKPMRTLTTSVKTIFPDAPVISVRTDGEIEKSKLQDAVERISKITVDQRVKIGDVVIENVCGSGVNIICTSDRLIHSY